MQPGSSRGGVKSRGDESATCGDGAHEVRSVELTGRAQRHDSSCGLLAIPLLERRLHGPQLLPIHRQAPPVDGSMTVDTFETLFAGNPPQRACSRMMSSSCAT